MKKTLLLIALILSGGIALLRAQQPGPATRAEAEKYYAEGSYARAHEIYGAMDQGKLSASEARWVQFRLADTLWRSEAATETSDSTKYEQAQHGLEVLVRDITRQEDRDLVWAEVQESLGDFYWMRRDSRNWSGAWPYYSQALDWWGGSDQIDTARDRYIAIVWKVARPAWVEPYYYYGYYGNTLPIDVLQNVLKIAKLDNDRAHAHYLIAMTLRAQGGYDQRNRVAQEFEASIQAGKTTDWYDDALFYYAEWLSQSGRMTRGADGQWRQELDYPRALELYRRLVAEHVKGETRYFDQAQQRIEEITAPVVSVSVSNIFLPDSEIQYALNWRNTKQIQLALYRVDLTRDIQFAKDTYAANFLQQINIAGRAAVKSWTRDTGDKGDYRPGQESLSLDEKLPAGAYILQAQSGRITARDLVLVTDTALILKVSGRKALVYYCNAITGAPVAGAAVSVWQKYSEASANLWKQTSLTTDRDGLAALDLTSRDNSTEIFAAASLQDRQAFSPGNSYSYYNRQQSWRIYAFTDRPAYRPEEKVQWKLTARQYDGSLYSTPANQTLAYEIYDPRNTKVAEGKAKLNAFGSAWGSMDTTASMPLGEYHVTFYDESKSTSIGGATLFRLEEYKLPEFKVSIKSPEESGKRKRFRVGDNVEVSIQADYYFGGPVASAGVEVVVYQNPFYPWWHRPCDYGWYYEDIYQQPRYWYGNGPIIKRETLKTDSEGKATLTFETPANSGQDFEYRVEARVTDASRREITATDSVRVTRQGYYVYPDAAHSIYRPQDKVQINIKAIDANSQPVEVEGAVKVTRDFWFEIWLDPSGKEVKGNELKALREKTGIFPPPAPPGQLPWRLKFQGYQHDDILTSAVKTDAEGNAEFTFTPEQEGYYRVAWSSPDQDAAPITAETTVWVATNASTELGYRQGGLQIIADKDTFRAGQTSPIMLSAPTNDRYVLFTVEGEDLMSYQLVHMTGTVKLLELPIEEKHVPNIFLGGVLVSDRYIYTDSKQVVVPPVKNFLQVDVAADRAMYQPREEGTLTVTTKDADGKPVSAEVALGLVDESVFYIQQDYAGDPKQFFFGEKRRLGVQTQSTFGQKNYIRFVRGENDILLDDRYAGKKNETGVEQAMQEGVFGGAPGGVAAGAMSDAMEEKAAPAPVAQRSQVAAKVASPAPPPAEAPEPGQQALPAVTVRSDFRSTVVWQPDIVTGPDGKAVVPVKYPDSLTGWTATARVASATAQFGIGNASTRTRQPLMVRIEAPRFFVTGDGVTLSALINNNTDEPLTVNVQEDADGFAMPRMAQPPVSVPANGEQRVDWHVLVMQPGTARFKVTVRGGKYADAMEKTYPIYEHGLERFLAKSGKARADEIAVSIDLPAQRKKESTSLTVQVTPSMAVTMLDALPYLIDYPYGCTEQTMSRFLPAVIVAKTLSDLGLAHENLEDRIFGGIEPGSAAKTHPQGKKDLHRLNDMVKASLDRLYDFQHSDGGWGWWKEGESDRFMTAYVLWGLTLAHNAGVEYAREDAASRAAAFITNSLVEEEESYDEQAWMLHAVSVYRAAHRSPAGEFEVKAFDNLWKNRDRLNAYTRALLALAAHSYGYSDKALTLVRNLENGVKKDTAPDTSVVMRGQQSTDPAVLGTAHWGEDAFYWRWSDGSVEATAFVLRALLAIDPQNPLVEPVTNWLIKNRRGAQWNNTRDTAITILTLDDYLRASGEMKADVQYELSVNGTSVADRHVTPQEVLAAPSVFAIDRGLLRDGINEVRIRRKSGSGPLYFSAQAKFFSLEEPVPASGNELFVRRQYYKLVGKPTLLKGYVYERHPLNDNESVKSGERIETVVTVEAKNNYEYLVFEDLKPAGFEAVEVRSGESLYARRIKSGSVAGKMAEPVSGIASVETMDYTGDQRWVYQELRDRKVALFIDKLPQGVWEIRYNLRAEVPGKFHALPLTGQAMYVPEIRANDAEVRVTVTEADSPQGH